MNHTVQWLTEERVPVCPDLTQYYIQINSPAGQYLRAAWVPLHMSSHVFADLDPGEYVEAMCAANVDGSVKEGWIERPFTVAGATPPIDPPPPEGPVPFPFPVWGDPWVPPPVVPGAVDKVIWEQSMIEWGVPHGDYLFVEPQPGLDQKIGHIYYDMARCMAQVAIYTETPEPWNGYATQAAAWYRDDYVLPNDGAVPGYQNFTTGLRMDYERTGNPASKDAVIRLSQNAAYASDATPPESVASHATNREVAYAILAYINAEKLGEAKREIRARYVTQSYAYLPQWYDKANWGVDQISPFMCGITAQALIADYEETLDPRCVPALLELAEWIWVESYHAPTHALLYQINPDSTEGYSGVGAPDLNLLVAPLYAWLWMMTSDGVHRDRFDELLLGSKDAYLVGGKQWDQNYWWSFDGMAWREAE